MNPSNTYQAVRIGDVADWRLICHLHKDGASAWLRHKDPRQPLITLFDLKWEGEAGKLLDKIEAAVYDHPQVLDDFAADIIVETPRTIWAPTDAILDDDDLAEEYYTAVHNAESADVMTEEVGDATALFSLTSGLNGFLQRTFPGARTHSHLAVLAKSFGGRHTDTPVAYIDIRRREADFLLFDERKNLLCAASHPWDKIDDIEYHLTNIMEVYGLCVDNIQISVSGIKEPKQALLHNLRKNIPYVVLTRVITPGMHEETKEMPTAVALVMQPKTDEGE